MANVKGAIELTEKQFNSAKTMTDRLGALQILLTVQNNRATADAALNKFFNRHEKDPLVIDKWFAVQAIIPGKRGLQRVKKLMKHPLYSLENPNRARALLAPFASLNMTGFHSPDGKGYAFYADQILAIDKINPQLAARLLTLMNNWRMFDKNRARLAKVELKRIAGTPGLSRDTQEIVDRALV